MPTPQHDLSVRVFGAVEPVTLLLLDGPAGDETVLLSMSRALVPGASILSVSPPEIHNGIRRYVPPSDNRAVHEAGLLSRMRELGVLLRATLERAGLDPRSVIAVGYSHGAALAAGLLVADPEALRACILIRPVVPMRLRAATPLAGQPVLVLAGRDDPIAPPEAVEELVSALSACGAAVTLEWSDSGHRLDPEEIPVARTWLNAARPAGLLERPADSLLPHK